MFFGDVPFVSCAEGGAAWPTRAVLGADSAASASGARSRARDIDGAAAPPMHSAETKATAFFKSAFLPVAFSVREASTDAHICT